MNSSNNTTKPLVLTSNEWNVESIKYMPPKINAMGGKSINMISTQSNRSLHISTPMMMTWGISDFINENGESDGKFSMTLNFPNDDYRKPSTDEFLAKIKAFENQILNDAVKNSDLWWGEEMSREVCKHSFFPFLKYTMIKGTKKIDTSKSPAIRAKVPFYNGKWGVECYNTRNEMVFPCDNENLTPVDFVPKLSQVACVLQCGGIWIGGKGWGVTWKVIQCVVKPREVISVYGKCHIQLSDDDRGAIETQTIVDDDIEDTTMYSGSNTNTATLESIVTKTIHNVSAEDSDEEVDDSESNVLDKSFIVDEIQTVISVPEIIQVAPPVAIKKKIIKKADITVTPAPAVIKKKIVKKKIIQVSAETA
jgi:hypothetical protein